MTPDLKRLCEAAEAADPTLAMLNDPNHSASEAIVRAVLVALREPSGAANLAGLAGGTDYPWDGYKPTRTFVAMIDHILAEPAKA